MIDDRSILELVSMPSPYGYLAEWVQAYAEQQWGQYVTLIHVMTICVSCLELTSTVVFCSPIEFLSSVFNVPLTLYSAKYSHILVYGIEL